MLYGTIINEDEDSPGTGYTTVNTPTDANGAVFSALIEEGDTRIGKKRMVLGDFVS